MKRYIFTLIIFLATYSLQAQGWLTSNRLAGPAVGDSINIIKTISDANNNTYIFGEFTNDLSSEDGFTLVSYGMRDYYLAKLDENADILWITNMGGTGNDFVLGGMGVNSNDEIIVTGGYKGSCIFTADSILAGTGTIDIFMAAYDTDGNLMWTKNVGAGQKQQRPSTLSIGPNDHILMAGDFIDSIQIRNDTTLYADPGIRDYYYAEFDPTGHLVWAKQIKFMPAAPENNALSGIIFDIQTAGTNYTLAGIFSDTVMIEDTKLVSETPGLYDVHLIQTDLQGNPEWIRTIKAPGLDYTSYSLDYDGDNNIYLCGYYADSPITADSTADESIVVEGNKGSYDIFVAKYNTAGTLQWLKTAGSEGADKLFDLEYRDHGDYERIWLAGYFTGTFVWGGTSRTTDGGNLDQDMMVLSMDLDGTPYSFAAYKGTNNSKEEAFSINWSGDELYTSIRSNSESLILDDPENPYVSSTGMQYVCFGVIGCLPISLDESILTNVEDCYGDATGSILIIAKDGFGPEWSYRIHKDSTFTDQFLYTGLPAGTYTIGVEDVRFCQEEMAVVITEPDSLEVTTEPTDAKCYGENGSIDITASGGTPAYEYSADDGINYTSEHLLSLPAGTYPVTVRDDKGCITSVLENSIIGEPNPITVEVLNIIDTITVNQHGGVTTSVDSGRIEVIGMGGTSPYEYTLIPGGTPQDHGTFTFGEGEGGIYKVAVTANNCGPVETRDTSIVQKVSGLETNAYISAKLYPNPTSGILNLEMQVEKAECSLEILNITGQVVMAKELYANSGMLNESIDLSELSKGVYIVRVNKLALPSAVVVQ